MSGHGSWLTVRTKVALAKHVIEYMAAVPEQGF